MLKDEYALKGTKVVNIVPLGDLHVGNRFCNYDLIDEWVKTVKRMDNKRIYLIGDLMEVANKHVGDSAFNQDMDVSDQKEFLKDLLKPFKKDIVGSVGGNHDSERTIKDFGIDLAKELANDLEVPYSFYGLDKFSVNETDITIAYKHGSGSVSKRELAPSKLKRDNAGVQADIHLNGHTHLLMPFSDMIKTINGYKRVYYCYCGSFLNYGGYAERAYLKPEVPGFMKLTINKNGIIKTNEYQVDEYWPDITWDNSQ